jgi:hypothetical protein
MLQTAHKEPVLESTDLQGYSDAVKDSNEKKGEVRDELNSQTRSATAVRELDPQPAPGIGNQSVAMPDDSAPDAATARTAAPAIRALNAPGGNTEAPPQATVGSVALARPAETVPDAASARTAAPAIRAMNAQSEQTEAPPNPCSMDVTYYVPKPPIIESSSASLQVGDQVRIQCGFEKRTRQLEWQQCDAAAQTANSILKSAEDSGSRFSGIVSINDGTVGVTTSPEDHSNFQNMKLWTFDEPGSYQVSCKIDNAFHYASDGQPTYLSAAISVDVAGRSDGLTFSRFEPGLARSVTTVQRPSQPSPDTATGSFRLRERAGVNRETADPSTDASPATRTEQNLRQLQDNGNNERN